MEQTRFRSRDPRDSINVDPDRLQMAFDVFKAGFATDEKPSEHAMYPEFSRRIARMLELVSLGDVSVELPKSKSSWQRHVQRCEEGERIALPLAVCQQIYAMTSIELTPDGSNFRVASIPVNSTEMVTLGPVTFVSSPDEPSSGELHVAWIQIEASAPKTYSRADFGHDACANDEYAKVTYYLEGVSLRIVGERSGTALLEDLRDGERTEFGSSVSLELRVDGREENVLRWNSACPKGRDALQGQFKDLRLAHLVTDGGDLRLEISVDPNQIEPVIKRLDGVSLAGSERSAFRSNIEKQIFRHRIRDAGRIERFRLSVAHATTNAGEKK